MNKSTPAEPYRRAPVLFGAVACCVLFVACGGGERATSKTSSTPFCRSLKAIVASLEPETGPTAPQARMANYDRVAILLDEAEQTAPSTLTADIATFAAAIDKFKGALAGVGYDLDALFATPGGEKLAADTSHALSAAAVDYLTGPCALSPNGGEQRNP